MNDFKEVEKAAKHIEGSVRALGISKAFRGTNFMTQEVLGYYQRGTRQIELSTGKGLFSDRLFGVTVAVSDKKLDGECECFNSLARAVAYMDELRVT